MKAIGRAYLANCIILISLGVIILIILGPETISSALAAYKKHQPDFFGTFTPYRFKRFFQITLLKGPIEEEILNRGPVWLLAYYGFKTRNKYLTWSVYMAVAGFFNYQWADTHTFILPVFLAGIPSYILVIKTRNILTPILLHSLSNFSLYALAHIALYFKII